jgi:hypothetical protein
MSGSEQKIEGSEVSRALELDQHEQRQEEWAAMRREEAVADRLATQMARRFQAPEGS